LTKCKIPADPKKRLASSSHPVGTALTEEVYMADVNIQQTPPPPPPPPRGGGGMVVGILLVVVILILGYVFIARGGLNRTSKVDVNVNPPASAPAANPPRP